MNIIANRNFSYNNSPEIWGIIQEGAFNKYDKNEVWCQNIFEASKVTQDRLTLSTDFIELLTYNKLQCTSTEGFTYQAERILQQLKSQKISIISPSSIRNYLYSHPEIIKLLLPICKAISDEFIYEQNKISLEIYNDPEIEDEYLIFFIRFKHYSEEIIKRIKGLRSFYENQITSENGWILLTTDFTVPR